MRSKNKTGGNSAVIIMRDCKARLRCLFYLHSIFPGKVFFSTLLCFFHKRTVTFNNGSGGKKIRSTWLKGFPIAGWTSVSFKAIKYEEHRVTTKKCCLTRTTKSLVEWYVYLEIKAEFTSLFTFFQLEVRLYPFFSNSLRLVTKVCRDSTMGWGKTVYS